MDQDDSGVIPAGSWRLLFCSHQRVVHIGFIGLIHGLILAAWWPVIFAAIHDWGYDPDFNGLWLVPVLALILIVDRSAQWAQSPKQPIPWLFAPIGFISILLPLHMVLMPRLGVLLLILSFAITHIALFGLARFRTLGVIWLFLFWMIPPPLQLWHDLTSIMQWATLQTVTPLIEWYRSSAVITQEFSFVLASHAHDPWLLSPSSSLPWLTIAGSCSGIRSLYTLLILVTFLFIHHNLSLYRKLFILAAVPLVTHAFNTLRILLTFELHEAGYPQLAEGQNHWLTGMVTLLLSITVILTFLKLLSPPPEASEPPEVLNNDVQKTEPLKIIPGKLPGAGLPGAGARGI